MSTVNLDGFCEVQIIFWKKYTQNVGTLPCKKCGHTGLEMTSKWRCKCPNCNQIHTVKKPKHFPKNTNNTRNWTTKCDECGGTMQFHRGGQCGVYICRKCQNVLEV